MWLVACTHDVNISNIIIIITQKLSVRKTGGAYLIRTELQLNQRQVTGRRAFVVDDVAVVHTSSFALQLLGALGGASRALLFLLLLAALVEVLHHHADEHVEHEEANEEQEADEEEQADLAVVLLRLKR